MLEGGPKGAYWRPFEKRSARCARLLDASAVMALYLYQARLNKLQHYNERASHPVRAVVMLELMLNYIAAHDAQVTVIGLSQARV